MSALLKTGALALLFSFAFAGAAAADTLTVAAAPSAQDALVELGQRFEQTTGHHVAFTFGASGKLYAQLTQGAPFEVFFSADDELPAKLKAQGLSEAPKPYARGRLVVWVPVASPLDVTKGLALVAEPRVVKVALANPALAPYGRAAVEALKASKLYAVAAPKFVLGENVAQAAQFADSGAADLGLLPLSLALSPKFMSHGRYSLVEAKLHAPILADAVVMRSAAHPEVARQFLAFCTAPSNHAVWQRYGFSAE